MFSILKMDSIADHSILIRISSFDRRLTYFSKSLRMICETDVQTVISTTGAIIKTIASNQASIVDFQFCPPKKDDERCFGFSSTFLSLLLSYHLNNFFADIADVILTGRATFQASFLRQITKST